jgi:DNA-binding PadR family transcriptional regulator
MARRRVSNLLALAVLSCLNEKPMHPYEISTTLRSRGKEGSIKLNYGALYSVVENLTKHGLVEPQETVREGRRPERTVYRITQAGRDEHDDWLAELLSTPVREYTSLEAGLSLVGGLGPDEVARLLEDRLLKLKVEIAGIRSGVEAAEQMGVPELFTVESDFRAAMLEAEQAYVAALAARIRSGALAGTRFWRRLHELREEGVSTEEILADPDRWLGKEAVESFPMLKAQQ